MFALFYSLYFSMFTGSWTLFSISEITTSVSTPINALSKLVTSIFGEFQVTDLGNTSAYGWLHLTAFVLALITSIGVVVMAVKGVKKAFGIFFMGLRR